MSEHKNRMLFLCKKFNDEDFNFFSDIINKKEQITV